MRSSWKDTPYLNLDSGRLISETSKHRLPMALKEQRVSVYNGKKIESLIVRPYMIDQKISLYLNSRYSGKNIHIKKKKRKKK